MAASALSSKNIGMRKVLRFFFWGLVAVMVPGGALFGYFVYSPSPAVPRLTDKIIAELGIDSARVFATGISRGGSMALRLALEAPTRFRAVAAVSENVPAPENFKCKPAGRGTSSVMIMNGTEDPLVPFDGGDVNLFGFFVRRGKVLSSRASGQYFADLNQIAGAPRMDETSVAGGIR